MKNSKPVPNGPSKNPGMPSGGGRGNNPPKTSSGASKPTAPKK